MCVTVNSEPLQMSPVSRFYSLTVCKYVHTDTKKEDFVHEIVKNVWSCLRVMNHFLKKMSLKNGNQMGDLQHCAIITIHLYSECLPTYTAILIQEMNKKKKEIRRK